MKNIGLINLFLLFSLESACAENNSAILPVNYPVSSKIESIPLPPVGKRWILDEKFSDEFEGTKLDDSKWLDCHPNWIGREPGLFEPSQVSLKDGMLLLKGEKMDKEKVVHAYGQDRVFNISCAAVVSKTQEAHYGYYECRFKANKTTLSTTFWLSSRGGEGNFSTEGRQPEGAAKGKFSQELDICECIGRAGDFNGKFFSLGMNANIHYWFTPEGGSEKQDIRAKETRLLRSDGKTPSEGFNIYGCWWKDENTATFYLNNEQSNTVSFANRKTGEPFCLTEPMGLNMVVETYPQPWIALPTDEELSDPDKNTSYYDWVRSYILTDINKPDARNGNSTVFKEHLQFIEKPEILSCAENGKVRFQLAYTAGMDCEISILIYNAQNNLMAFEVFPVYSGYGNTFYSFPAQLTAGELYHAVAYIRPLGASGNENAFEGDSFAFKCR